MINNERITHFTTITVIVTALYCISSIIEQVSVVPTTINSPAQPHLTHIHLTTTLRKDKDGTESTNPNPSSSNTIPETAWLLNYPNSRSSYVQKLIRLVSHTTMASNYITDVEKPDAPVVTVSKNHPGPFVIERDPKKLTIPSSYLLTETHCTGYVTPYSAHNNSSDVVYERSVEEFFLNCAAGVTSYGHRSFLYDPKGVKRVVHLVRDPFDNLVNRFVNEAHLSRVVGDKGGFPFQQNRGGFRAWCEEFDASVRDTILVNNKDVSFDVVRDSVPCYGLFYQYILWHNNVGDMVSEKNLQGIVIHYEDFKHKSEESTINLLTFLELPAVGKSPNVPDDNFSGYFTPEERTIVSSFLKVIASERTWVEIERYLCPEQQKAAHLPLQFASLGNSLSPRHYGKWPDKLIWLMSFPRSGEDTVGRVVSGLSGTTIATNYGERYGVGHRPNAAYTAGGPYRTSSLPFPEHYIMVETFCNNGTDFSETGTGAATAASANGLDVFLRSCTQTTREGDRNGTNNISGGGGGNIILETNYYDAVNVEKVVHLVRNPFDNAVARFHNELLLQQPSSGLQQAAAAPVDKRWPFSYDAKGFKSWCRDRDDRVVSFTAPADRYPEDVAALAKYVPCHTILYEYLQWHNHAFAVPTRLRVRSMVLYYEDLDFDKEGVAVDRLMEFLDLRKEGVEVTNFHHESYPNSMTSTDYEMAIKFIRLVGSSETNDALARYFR